MIIHWESHRFVKATQIKTDNTRSAYKPRAILIRIMIDQAFLLDNRLKKLFYIS